MKVINRDLTREKVTVFVSKKQIYVTIHVKNHGKWVAEEYFQEYDWNIDQELVESTLRYIKRTWGLKNPQVVVK